MKALRIVNFLLALDILLVGLSMLMYKITGGDELYGEIHENAGIVFFVLALFHIYLNRKWIKSAFFKKKSN